MRSMKNIVRRTVSKIESHVASVTSSTRRASKGDSPKRTSSQHEAESSVDMEKLSQEHIHKDQENIDKHQNNELQVRIHETEIEFKMSSTENGEKVKSQVNEEIAKGCQNEDSVPNSTKIENESTLNIDIQEASHPSPAPSSPLPSSPASTSKTMIADVQNNQQTSNDVISNGPSSFCIDSIDNESPRATSMLPRSPSLPRIQENTESVSFNTSPSTPPTPRAFPSPTTSRVPFSYRLSPKLNHRTLLETVSLPFNNSKPLTTPTINIISVHSQLNKGDQGLSDSENEENQPQILLGDRSQRIVSASRSPYLTPKFHSRRGSYFFKRRVSSESLASLSENESTDEAVSPISASDFNQLKETAERLHLSTRRPSVLQWRQQYVDTPSISRFAFKNGINGDSIDERLTSERKQKIDEALEWIRNELVRLIILTLNIFYYYPKNIALPLIELG